MKEALYRPLGFLFLGLAILGFLLPVLPGTPFLLLAAWFFARSSAKWHAWLLNSELFGPVIRNWEENRCIAMRTKLVAITSMAVAGSATVVFALDTTWLRATTVGLMMIGAITILSIRTCSNEPEAGSD